jgi:EmrB/QacA subfamily drug resistance transporter
LLFVGVLMGAIDIAIIGPALPAIQAEFDMNNRQLAVLFNAYVLCQMIGAQLLTKFSDRFGPRAIYQFSIGCFAVGSMVIVMATDQYLLYLGRAIQGFGAGGIFPVASAVIATRLPPRERGPALGVLGSVFGLAFIIGPILGGILLRFSWHWLFLVNLPIAAVLMIGAWKLLPTRSEHRRRPFDLSGTLMLIVGLTSLVVGINNLDTSDVFASLMSMQVWPLLLTFCLLLPLFWRVEKRVPDPIVLPAFFASRQILTACIISAGVGAMQTASVFYPILLVASMGLSEANAALLLIPGVLASTLFSPVAGRLINVVGTRNVVMFSLVLSFSTFMVYGHRSLTIEIFVLASIVSGIGLAGLLGAPLRCIVLNETAPRDRASAQGFLSVSSSIGRLLGAATVGAVASSKGGGVIGYQAAFIGMAFLTSSLFLLATLLKSKRQEDLLNADADAAPAAASA